MTAPRTAPEALRLAAADEGARALELVRAAPGDPQALLALALWEVEGRLLPRDLAAAREHVARAAALGSAAAARILGAFLACGTGGVRDWAGAIAILDRWAAHDPVAAAQARLISEMRLDVSEDPKGRFPREPLCATPSIFFVRGLLTPAECHFLAQAAEARLKPATVFSTRDGRFVRHPVRSSDGAGFGLIAEWPAIHALNCRIAAATGTDVRQGESLQLLRYRPGQEYRPHLDAVPGLANQRATTAIIYLNDSYAGGATSFSHLALQVRGQTGDMLVFANVDAQGRPDPTAEHAGLPVTAGEKLIATRWIRSRPAPEGEAFDPAEVERG